MQNEITELRNQVRTLKRIFVLTIITFFLMVCGYGCGSSSSNVESQIDSLEFNIDQCESAMMTANTSKFMTAVEGIQNAMTYLSDNKELVENYFTDNGNNPSSNPSQMDSRIVAYMNKLRQSRNQFDRIMKSRMKTQMGKNGRKVLDEIRSNPEYLARYRKLDFFMLNYPIERN
jgi:hypothetical protein